MSSHQHLEISHVHTNAHAVQHNYENKHHVGNGVEILKIIIIIIIM